MAALWNGPKRLFFLGEAWRGRRPFYRGEAGCWSFMRPWRPG